MTFGRLGVLPASSNVQYFQPMMDLSGCNPPKTKEYEYIIWMATWQYLANVMIDIPFDSIISVLGIKLDKHFIYL